MADLKALTHDLLYETYRTEKLSRTVHSDTQDWSILPEELASQSVRLKEEQLRREEEKVSRPPVRVTCADASPRQLREIELRVQREINEKRQELLAKEESLRSVLPLLPSSPSCC